MAKVRSPNYPAMDFAAASKAAHAAFDKDNRNKMSQAALGKHLGHESLSGPALGKIGALRAYGLIEGKGDELRITEDAVHALMAPEGSQERAAAVATLVMRPKLFQEIAKDFPTPPSLDNLKFWLIKRQFKPDAAEKAAKCYLTSMRVVSGGLSDYDSNDKEAEQTETFPVTPQVHTQPKPTTPPAARFGQQHAVFPLAEGEVTLSFPAEISVESAQMMASFVNLALKQAEMQAKAREAAKE